MLRTKCRHLLKTSSTQRLSGSFRSSIVNIAQINKDVVVRSYDNRNMLEYPRIRGILGVPTPFINERSLKNTITDVVRHHRRRHRPHLKTRSKQPVNQSLIYHIRIRPQLNLIQIHMTCSCFTDAPGLRFPTFSMFHVHIRFLYNDKFPFSFLLVLLASRFHIIHSSGIHLPRPTNANHNDPKVRGRFSIPVGKRPLSLPAHSSPPTTCKRY